MLLHDDEPQHVLGAPALPAFAESFRLLSSITSSEVPPRRSALSVCPGGDPWGTPTQLEIRDSWAPGKPPRGQTLRSPRPTVTSVLTRYMSKVLKFKSKS